MCQLGRLDCTGQTDVMDDTDGAVRGRVWRDGQVVVEDFDFARISDYLEEQDCLTWVDLCDPDHRILQDLAGELVLEPLAVKDAIAHSERAKATRYATHTFMTVYTVKLNTDAPNGADGRLTIHKISAFVFPRGLITVRASPDFDIEDVVHRWDDNADLLKYGVGALVHGLLDMIVDGHFEAVQILDDAMEDLEGGLFDEQALSAEVQRATYQVRKDLVELRRVVLPMREVINSVLRHRKDFNAPTELDPGMTISTTTSYAPRNGPNLYATWSPPSSNQPLPARRPPEQRHEKAHRLGRDHRRPHRRHRLLRAERPLPRLRQGIGLRHQHRRHPRHRRSALLHLQTQKLDLVSCVNNSFYMS